MEKNLTMQELYIGCDCLSLDHIIQFIHFPLSEEGKIENKEAVSLDPEDDENIIYFAAKVENYFYKIVPPILLHCFDKYNWQSYFRYMWFHRLWIAMGNISSPKYRRRWGILDSFDFQQKDFEKIDAFIALISRDIDTNINEKSEVVIKDNNWSLIFHIEQFIWKEQNYKEPWKFGFECQFKKKKILGRIKDSFKYIFGIHDDQVHVSIDEKNAAKIRGMLKWVQDTNKKEEDAEEN